jgi:hypothetical protein
MHVGDAGRRRQHKNYSIIRQVARLSRGLRTYALRLDAFRNPLYAAAKVRRVTVRLDG